VHEPKAAGSLAWVTARETDGNGRVKLDLDGLDAGLQYALRVNPYPQNIERDVSASDWSSIRAAGVPVTLLNGDTGDALANTNLTLLTRDSSTSALRYEFHGDTDAHSKPVFEPAQLGAREHALRAASTVGGSLKLSPANTSAGPLTFAKGNRQLTVTLVRAKDKQRCEIRARPLRGTTTSLCQARPGFRATTAPRHSPGVPRTKVSGIRAPALTRTQPFTMADGRAHGAHTRRAQFT